MSRYSATDAALLGQLAESALPLAERGETAEAASVLHTCALLVADGHPLPPVLAKWLVGRLQAAAGSPFELTLFERNAAQSREDGEFWPRFSEARAAWVAKEATNRGRYGYGKTGKTEKLARTLKISLYGLRKRFRKFGFKKRSGPGLAETKLAHDLHASGFSDEEIGERLGIHPLRAWELYKLHDIRAASSARRKRRK